MLFKELFPFKITNFSNLEIKGLTSDSRQVEEGYVFVCINGPLSDGHNYAASALEKGASVIVSERDLGIENQVIIKDTRTVYAKMCSIWFGNPSESLKLIGVTGTNGKTSVTYMLKRILEHSGEKVGLIGTIQNMIGDEIIEAKNTTPGVYELNSLFAQMVKAG